MGSTILVIANLAVVIASVTSTVRFWSDGGLGATSIRRLASLGAALTLLIALIIYSGEFERVALAALRSLGVDNGLYERAQSFLSGCDVLFTGIANAANDALSTARVGYRPYPPAWPAVCLVTGYGVRFLIYRFHTKKGNAEAALTGSVYWSHVTTYTMCVAFLIVIVGLNPWLLVPLSLLAVGGMVVSVKLIAEDLGVVVQAVAGTLWTGVVRVARRLAYFATELAATLRMLLAYASRGVDPLSRTVAGFSG